MKKIYLLILMVFLFVTDSLAQVTVSGSTGADGAYANLTNASAVTGAFAAINATAQTGNNIVITISADIVETGFTSLNAGNWTTLTINPTGGVPRQVSGNINGFLINLNGADNVTVDGLNSGGNALTFTNTSGMGGATTLRFASDATNNTIIRCTLLGSSGATAGTGFATIYFATGPATGNDNNTITQCNISASVTGTPRYAVQSAGTSFAIDNSNNTISGNNISDFFNAAATSAGINIAANNSDWTITGNKLYQTATRTATAANTHNGILISSGAGYTISNNVIGFANTAGTGTTNMIGLSSGSLGGTFPSSFTAGGTANATRYNAIQCAFTAGGTVSSIQNNTIGGIALYITNVAATSFGLICGIAVTSGNANIGTVTGNTIGSSTGTSSIYAATTTVAGVISGIYCTSTNTINIQNNTMGGIDVSGTTDMEATGFKGIEVIGTGTFTISNNTIGNAVANNIRTGYLVTGANLSNTATTPIAASGAANVRAIVSQASGASLTISNNIMQGFQSSGTGSLYRAISNSGFVSGTINITGNQIGTASTGAVNFIAATGGGINGIYNTAAASTSTINVTGNTIQGISLVSSGILGGIDNTGLADSDVAINISDNQFGTATGDFVTYSAATSNTINAVVNAGGTANCVLTIQNNSIRGIVHSVTSSSAHQYISNTATGLFAENILNNIFVNLNVNTTGNITFIRGGGGLVSGRTSSCNNNSIVTAFNKSGASGNVYFYLSGGNNVNGSVMTETGNNFSNVTISGSGTIYGWQNQAGVSSSNGPTRIITGNTFSNITGGSGVIYPMYLDYGGPTTCSSNTITNISGTGSITAIFFGSNNGPGTHHYSSNTISSLISSGTGGSVTGISGSPGVIATYNVNSNSITGLSSTGASSVVEGIRMSGQSFVSVNDNSINNLSSSGTTAPKVRGIMVTSAFFSLSMYRNKIINLEVSAAITTTEPSVLGMEFSINDVTGSIANNFIADLRAPAINYTDAIQGMSFENFTYGLNGYGIVYNSIYLNAGSTGTNFGTTGIYHASNYDPGVSPIFLANNIIVNTSTPNGTGRTVVFRRGGSELDNYSFASDHNLFYAGTPSANRLLYDDGFNANQTMTTFKATVSPREANSISLMSIFVSATDLHLTDANCGIDGKGTPVSITTDIDGTTRNVTTPDIGADEFTATYGPTLAGVVSTAVCDNKTVSTAGTYYATSACDLIARVVPSGGTPVGGKINACVTLDATSIPFNGEPYVQRHYDIEPAISPATATATVTLYFDNAEFMLYNTTNPAWPPLPTFAGDPNTANVKVTQFHGTPTGGLPTSTPGNYSGARVLLTPVSVILTGTVWAVTVNVAGFSGFYVHSNLWNGPLPVTVNYFTGTKQGGNHLLNWKVTCNSTPRVTMTLERSSDSRNFTTDINSITADAARCQQPFNYTDTDPSKGMNYYRLKIVDADGKITYSSIIALLNAVKGFDIVSIAPNPVTDGNFKLNVASAQSSKMEFVIFDMQGRVVNRQTVSVVAGFNSLPVNLGNLSPGTYTIYGKIEEDKSKMIRFVKQ